MRKFFLLVTLLAGFSKALFAQFGNCTASEMQTYTDRETGNTITILTDTLKNDLSSIRQTRCGHMTENIYYSGHPVAQTIKR